MQEQIRIPVVKGEQNGRTIYVGLIPAKELARMYDCGVAKVDIWGPGNPRGYQRTLSATRARSFGRYLGEGRNLSPTSVLLHIRGPGNGVRLDGGSLIVPLPPKGETSPKPLIYIVDGQHRSFGISYAMSEGAIEDGRQVDIPVTVWMDDTNDESDSRLDEAEQFETINTEAKRVRTDLAHQILLKTEESKKGKFSESSEMPIGKTREELVTLATFITNELAQRTASPLFAKIVRPNVPKNTTGLPSQGQFEDSILDNYLGSGSVVTWAAGAGLNAGSVIKLLSNYWGAIFELRPEALKNPEEYFLTKTLGVHAMNGVLPAMISRCHLPSVPSEDKFKEVLGELEAFTDDDFWTTGGQAGNYGGGKKAFKALAKDIVESLKSPS